MLNDACDARDWPRIIQGGMGVGVSSWRLARAVSSTGQLGVVSGTALDQLLVRRLQDGDPGGHVREALSQFPVPALAERIRERYFIPGGKASTASYTTLPLHDVPLGRDTEALIVVANFVEVWLARQGHDNPVGINYLEKIQVPHLASLYGAMLAGVDVVLMGAGIPLRIPGALDRLANHEDAQYPLAVTGSPAAPVSVHFDPRELIDRELPPLRRPLFFAIVSSATLATTLLKRANGRVDGFVIEGPTAGGHNAPPRGKLQLDELGQPIYGERDVVDLAAFRAMDRPFWLAGGYGRPHAVDEARALGAEGIQVGTLFAFCEESGLRPDLKRAVLDQSRGGTRVLTDAVASPTGFPFKVVQLPGTVADPQTYGTRPRICDLGYLREAYVTPSGAIAYRCAAEPVSLYTSKGGVAEDAANRKCLCNALIASAGHPQVRAGRHIEPGIVTSGDAIDAIGSFMPADASSYTAADVIARLL